MRTCKRLLPIMFLSIFLICFVLTDFIFAEELKEWGVVNPEYLNMTVYPADTSASAITLFDVAAMDLISGGRVEMILERHFQIKILKEKGKEYADIAISYWHKDLIRDLEAQIILPSGKSMDLDDDNIFDEEAKGWYKVKKLTFPNVQVGSILEVKYKQISEEVYELRPWYFHKSIPVVESEITLQLAPFFSYFIKIGNDPDNIVQQTEDRYYNNHRRDWENRYRYRATNLPAIKDEPFISTLNNYKAHVNFQIESYSLPGFHREFIQDLQTLSNTLLEEKYADFDSPESEVETLVESLISPQMSGDGKAQRIFEYVRDNFNSARNTSIYVSRNQEEIIEQRKASDTEKNMLMKVMLQAAGFDVFPVLISTTDHGIANPEIPFLSQYNKTILLVNISSNYYLFDARDPWVTYGQLPPSSLVKNAMLVQKDNSSFLEIPNTGMRSLDIIESKIQLDSNGNLSGSSEILAIGYASSNYNRKLYKHKTMQELLNEEVVDRIEGFKVIKTDTTLTAIPSDTFNTIFDFTIENYAEIIDNDVYLKAGLYYIKDKNIFVSEKRVFPIEFGYLRKSIETTYFTLPEDFTISELPEEIIIENEYIRYQRMVLLTNNDPITIGYSRQFEIKDLVVPTKKYEAIKNDFSKIVDSDQEIIILQKLR